MFKPKTILDATNMSIPLAETVSHVASKVTELEVAKESVTEIATKFSDTFYNKYNNKDALYCHDFAPEGAEKFAEDENIYVDVAKMQPDYDWVKIGSHTYKDLKSFDTQISENRFKEISIGKNAFLYINAWKVVDGVLKVAIPYLYSGMDVATGTCVIETSGGLSYEIQVADPSEAALKISSAAVTEKDGYTSECVVEGTVIHAKLGHFNQALAVVLNDGNSDINNPSTVLYRVDQYGNMGITVPETIGGIACTYARYLFAWANEAVTEEIHKDYEVTLMVPTKGSITFTIDATAVVDTVE